MWTRHPDLPPRRGGEADGRFSLASCRVSNSGWKIYGDCVELLQQLFVPVQPRAQNVLPDYHVHTRPTAIDRSESTQSVALIRLAAAFADASSALAGLSYFRFLFLWQ